MTAHAQMKAPVNMDWHNLFETGKNVRLKDFSGSSFAQILTHLFFKTERPLVIVVEDQRRAEVLSEEIGFFSGSKRIEILPAFDVRPYYGISPHRSVTLRHLRILSKLLADEIDILIVPKISLFRRMVPRSLFAQLTMTLAKNDLVERDELISSLIRMGYERYSVVEEPGQFAVRGDVIDIFSPQYDEPLRLSFFDIELDDMKFFDPVSQRTAKGITQVSVIPAHEIFLNYCATKNRDDSPDDKKSSQPKEIPLEINQSWKSDLKRRADQKSILKEKRDQIEEFISNRVYFHGIEFFLPLFYNKTDTLFDYVSRKACVVFDLDNAIELASLAHLDEMTLHYDESEHIEAILKPEEIYLTVKELSESFAKFNQIYNDNSSTLPLPLRGGRDAEGREGVTSVTQTTPIRPSGTFPPPRGKGNEEVVLDGACESNLLLKSKITTQVAQIHSLAPLASEINQKRLEGFSCFIVCQNPVQLERMKDLLQRFELPLSVISPELQNDVVRMATLSPSGERLVRLMVGALSEGFLSRQNAQWWIADEEIFGKKTRRVSSSKKRQGTVFSSFSELTDGDFIIHMDHGIGIYHGLVKLDYDVNKNDFLLIEYLGGDKLYVPIDKLNRVQRFAAEEGVTPQLDKLGGVTWIKTRTKAKRAARKLAQELLQMQARRETLTGQIYSTENEQIEEFAASFEFDETPDQLQAIEDVNRDMTGGKPMDRLVCGDVGYGKTEVAMRAAFLAAANNKQVAVLVPTTVLALQHAKTFAERFKNYAVRVELISRLRSNSEQNEIVAKLKTGEIDIVIGTHRLLSQDIKFRDLGLLVIDEEHRFGVIHKEKIKKLKNLVDVITLTATPIPRTLNFALNGIRDLSIINTPPVDRLAVKTFSCYFDDITIRDAILKELRRGGQIYFVHNRVQSIERMTTQLSKLVPEARFRFAHGQMEEGQLEKIMIDFMNHEFDVLISTTIIESGLDIPNANTMIINRADALGLAQLYQLRGRVGRSSHQAYCYLIIPQETLITAKAKKRLDAIQRFTELGSGFKVATRDLEIRGAGNILGDEQSGHIAAIGYDLYAQLLQEAINEIKNVHVPEDFEPEIQLNLAAKIPDEFIPDQQLRLVLYKQLSTCENAQEIADTCLEWEDRFGKLPDEIKNLAALIRVKLLCKAVLVSQLKQAGDSFLLSFHENHRVDTQILIDAVKKNPKKFSVTRDGRFNVTQKFASSQDMLNYLIELLEKFRESVG